MTFRAVRAELPEVNLRLGVARHTRTRRAPERIVDVTRLAIRCRMFAGQLEARQVVVEVTARTDRNRERSNVPVVGRVTVYALGSELTHVGLRFRVARNACLRRSPECVIDVARLAICRRVFARQGECCVIVVELAEVGERTMSAVVFAVATPALGAAGEFTVHRTVRVELLPHVGVAFEAAIRHRLPAPW